MVAPFIHNLDFNGDVRIYTFILVKKLSEIWVYYLKRTKAEKKEEEDPGVS